MRKSIQSMRAPQPKPDEKPPLIMDSMLARALLCPGDTPATSGEDIDRRYEARVSATTDPLEIERLQLARDLLKRDMGNLFGNMGKVVESMWFDEPIVKPVAKPAKPAAAKPATAKPATTKAVEAVAPIILEKNVAFNQGFVDDLRQIFAEEFEEKQGNCVSFNELLAVFVRCKGTVTDRDRRLFRFYCKSVFLEQWKAAKHVVHRNKRAYRNVIEKKKD